MVEKDVTCDGCVEKVEFSSKEIPCKLINGWLMSSQWVGLGSVEHYNFCSLACLKKWADAQNPEIPRVYVESFTDEEGEGNPPLNNYFYSHYNI